MKKLLRVLLVAAVSVLPFAAEAAGPDFLQDNIGATVNLFTGTELNTLASGSAATSTTGCTSGVCSASANFGSAIWATAWFTAGGAAGGTAALGANISCWFINSTDGGTTFEETDLAASTTVPAMPRAADFQIAIPNVNLVANHVYYANGYLFRLPAGSFKVICQNNIGQALNAASNKISIAGMFIKY